MPCLRLTLAQASRFWGLEEPACAALLNRLTRAGFLELSTDGSYRLGKAAVS